MKFFSKKNENLFDTAEESESVAQKFGTVYSPNALTPEEIMNLNKRDDSIVYDGEGALESLRKRISAVANNEPLPELDTKPTAITEVSKKDQPIVAEKTETEPPKKDSLTNKCLPFFLDEQGKDASVNKKPLYKLQSVAEILENESNQTLEMLSKQYGISFRELDKKISTSTPQTSPTQTVVDKTDNKASKVLTDQGVVKKLQTNVTSVISDIDDSTVISSRPSQQENNDATITFTPVNDNKSLTTRISVSTHTKSLEIIPESEGIVDEDDFKREAPTLEKSDFEDYSPTEEHIEGKNSSKLLKELFIKKRSSFISTIISVFVTIVLAIFRLPIFSGLLLSKTVTCTIIFICLVSICAVANLGMFKSFAGIFSKKFSADISVVLSTILTIAYAIYGIFSHELVLDMLLLISGILSFRAISEFWKSSYMYSNLKQIASGGEKTAIRLIDDSAVTMAMTKNSIDGDALVVAPCKTAHIKDYFKYSTYGSVANGKISIIILSSFLLSAACGLIAAVFFDSIQSGLYAAATIQCFSAIPTLFFIDALPIYSASKKLNSIGAMISGKTGAEFIEKANALVLNSTDIFPKGTVTLHQIKALSNNNLDQTLINAAALTEYMQSPLAPIFKGIAKTGNITKLPDTDTVKYEDRMGISGWVDNRLLIIGNRTLLESRGIEVPSIEFDRKILRNGFFPVYVATGDKTCALLVVQYNVNPQVAQDLRYLSRIGVTMLINNNDPNLTEEMICDYLGLYEDSVKIMSSVGTHIYKNNNISQVSVSAPAAYRGNHKALAKIVCCANKITKCNSLLNILYFISAPLGAILFAYTSFGGGGELMNQTAVLGYCAINAVISYLLYLIKKP